MERKHIDSTISWINSGEEIFRQKKPNIPPKHLVSYFVVVDDKKKKILLVDHKKAMLWLPSGGHVEPNEYPKITVERECLEELDIEAEFIFERPIFLTSTVTTGLTAGHTDVSLWYVLRYDSDKTINFDRDEFNDIRWFTFDKVPYGKTDPHMSRFVNKLENLIFHNRQ